MIVTTYRQGITRYFVRVSIPTRIQHLHHRNMPSNYTMIHRQNWNRSASFEEIETRVNRLFIMLGTHPQTYEIEFTIYDPSIDIRDELSSHDAVCVSIREDLGTACCFIVSDILRK